MSNCNKQNLLQQKAPANAWLSSYAFCQCNTLVLVSLLELHWGYSALLWDLTQPLMLNQNLGALTKYSLGSLQGSMDLLTVEGEKGNMLPFLCFLSSAWWDVWPWQMQTQMLFLLPPSMGHSCTCARIPGWLHHPCDLRDAFLQEHEKAPERDPGRCSKMRDRFCLIWS